MTRTTLPPTSSGSAILSMCFCSWHQDIFFRTPLLVLVHMLTVVDVLTLVNAHRHQYDVRPMATLIPTLTWFKFIHVNPI